MQKIKLIYILEALQMAGPINPKSLRQLAIKNGIHRQTVEARLKRGVDKMMLLYLENQRIK